MQLAGALCKICERKILMQADGTWCARCNSIFHRDCIQSERETCVGCGEPIEAPENHFVYSKQCPECMRSNDPPKVICMGCGTSTCWDNRSNYDEFVEHMKDTSRVYFVRGAAELGVGLLCLLLIIILFTAQYLRGFPLVALFLGVMILIPRGILTIRASRRIARFE